MAFLKGLIRPFKGPLKRALWWRLLRSNGLLSAIAVSWRTALSMLAKTFNTCADLSMLDMSLVLAEIARKIALCMQPYKAL